MPKKRLVFVIDEERDRDILVWWKQQANKSASLRTLIRRDIRQDDVTLRDVYQTVIDIDRKLTESMPPLCHNVDEEPFEEPPDVAAALDNLGV
jgi:hypothetical protein